MTGGAVGSLVSQVFMLTAKAVHSAGSWCGRWHSGAQPHPSGAGMRGGCGTAAAFLKFRPLISYVRKPSGKQPGTDLAGDLRFAGGLTFVHPHLIRIRLRGWFPLAAHPSDVVAGLGRHRHWYRWLL
jgi:hypothetical protein